MSSLFKKRLCCFYCGRRSVQSQPGPIRQWQCQQCLAVNYLDEHGEITDPPASAASSGVGFKQYAQPLPGEFAASDSSIFCSTCLKNQHVLTQTLASYLPMPTHPDFETYEASYPEYRKSLEERYPQVCEKCEPRVRSRIEQAGYVAKADHLRRMMEKSRNGRSTRRYHGWSWRSLLISAGAMCFRASVAGQLVWNLMGAMVAGNITQNTESDLSLSLLPLCFGRIWKHQSAFEECSSVLTPYAGLSLILGILSIWWNPKLKHKVEGRGGRLTGIGEYYKVQIIVLVVRFVAWACLEDPSITGINPKLGPGIHAFMGIFTTISTVLSRYVIKFDTTPLISWQSNIGPLISQKSEENNASTLQTASAPHSKISSFRLDPSLQRFPINSLAPPRPLAQTSCLPPFPKADVTDDSDAMDWIPSQQPLQINVTPKHVQSQEPRGPLPFQGQLPPIPKPPAWRLRNPIQERPKAPEPKPNPFQNAPVLQPNLPSNQGSHMESVMAPPKYFPPSDFAAETGLESLFDKAFSIRDDPVSVQKQPWSSESKQRARASARSSRILKCVLLAISISILLAAQAFQLPGNSVGTAVLGISLLISGFSLLESLMRPLAVWSAVDIILSVVELAACICLAIYSPQGLYDRYKFETAGKCLVAFMAGQEMIALGSFFSRKAAPAQNSRKKQQTQSSQPPQPPNQTTCPQTQRCDDPLKKEPNLPSLTNLSIKQKSIRGTPANSNSNNNRTRNTPNNPTPSNPHSTNTHSASPAYNNLASHSNDPTATHPAPYSAIPRPGHLSSSFSSFNSLPDSLRFTPPSATTATTSTSCASEIASEPATPQRRYAYSRSTLSPARQTPSSGIGGLSLDDDPLPQCQPHSQSQSQSQSQSTTRTMRYALRSRRG
ncbi:hypothetical protein PABG_04132 [Paracoccidioides brasiliensis Pb03]|nr:hypothetical protein PABG_04132 [Paracoccidioides brasiliensis Pb03]